MPIESDFPLNAFLRARAEPARIAARPFVIGVAGSVAVGKSTFAGALHREIAAWPERPKVEGVATDGFLFPNRVLAEREIAMRKGFPESFDFDAMRAAIAAIRRGEAVGLPLYSHTTYDVEPDRRLDIERPGVLILDGLHLSLVELPEKPRLIDCLIYLDADEEVIENWFTRRLLPLMEAGVDDSNSFYHAFRHMTGDDRRAFASRVWQGINLPNLRNHIVADRAAADLVLRKSADHRIISATVRAP